MIGAVVGDYELLALLGTGGMGSVYRARHRALGLERALKLVDQVEQPERLERFTREGANLARAQHENVVRVHEAGHDRGRPYLVMDLVEGVPLDRLLAGGRVPMKRALALAVGLARGVTALHAAGVVHRDLKPQNVIVRGDGQPVIIDLGLAIAPERDARLTRSGALLGTPTHMAPEQLLGRPAGPAADVFALGLIVFELTTGAPAVPARDTLMGLIDEVTSRPRPRAREVAPTTPAWLDELLARALERDPAWRPSASELAAALRSRSAAEVAPRRGAGPRVALAALIAAVLLVAALLATRPAAPPATPAPVAPPAVTETRPVAADPEAARQLRRIEREPDPAARLEALTAWLTRWPADPEVERARALERQVRVLVPVELGAAAGTRWVCFLDDARVLTGGEGGLDVWDAARGGSLGRWVDLPCRGPIVALRDGRVLASDERRLRLVVGGSDAVGRVRAELELDASIFSLAAAADGRTALAGLSSGVAAVVDLAAWRITARLVGHEHAVYAVALSDDGRLALTGTGEGPKVGQDDAVRLWEARDGRLLRREALEDRVGVVSFLPGAREFLAGTAAGRLFRFSVERAGSTAMFVNGEPAGSPLLQPVAHPGPIRGLVVSADGRRAWSVSGGPPGAYDVLMAWDVDEMRARRRVTAAGRALQSVDVSPDGQRLVTGGREAPPAVWATD